MLQGARSSLPPGSAAAWAGRATLVPSRTFALLAGTRAACVLREQKHVRTAVTPTREEPTRSTGLAARRQPANGRTTAAHGMTGAGASNMNVCMLIESTIGCRTHDGRCGIKRALSCRWVRGHASPIRRAHRPVKVRLAFARTPRVADPARFWHHIDHNNVSSLTRNPRRAQGRGASICKLSNQWGWASASAYRAGVHYQTYPVAI